MKDFLRYILSLFVLLLCFYSCGSKDKDILRSDILTSKTWKRGIMDKNLSTNPSIPSSYSQGILYAPVSSCQKDDVFHFNPDGELIIDNGPDKCSADEQATQTVNYSYDKINNDLTIGGIKYKVAEMSSTQIKYYVDMPYVTGYSYMVYLLQ